MNFIELIEERNTKNAFMALLGIKITDMAEGYAAGEIILGRQHKNLIGTAHGGCIFSLADSVVGAAAVSLGNRSTTVTTDFHYLAPALNNEKLTAEATLIKNGKTIVVFDVAVRDEQNKLLAKGTFTYFNLGKI